mmetsp:Transcript_15259/g.37567  ORF Transcript_15259/g.37567 Transcript_15259/m.37567 type:complete len:295 (-) Transcript_15259:228-1112(-)
MFATIKQTFTSLLSPLPGLRGKAHTRRPAVEELEPDRPAPSSQNPYEPSTQNTYHAQQPWRQSLRGDTLEQQRQQQQQQQQHQQHRQQQLWQQQQQQAQLSQYPMAAVAAAAPDGAVPMAMAMPVGAHQQPIPLGYHPEYGMPAHAMGMMHLPDLPDAIQAWNRLKHLMALWMTFSILMVVCSPFIIFIGLPVGVLGIVAASLHLFEACRGRASIVGSVVTIKVLALVIASLEFVLAAILLLLAAVSEERGAIWFLIVLSAIYGLHGTLSLVVFLKMQYISKLLNPIQSGMVVL